MSRRRLVSTPSTRSVRLRSVPTVRSTGGVFLSFSREAYQGLSNTGTLGQTHPDPLERWRHLEHCARALGFACTALEAHLVGVHQCFFGRDFTTRQINDWRERPLVERLSSVLPRRAHSLRRQRLLQDVLDLEHLLRQPPPFQVAEQIDLFERSLRPAGYDFWFGRTAWARRSDRAHRGVERGHAELPRHPLDLTTSHISTALLIVLEHCVLLDRIFASWAEHPLTGTAHEGPFTATGWFEEIRADYAGPHAAYFRRVVTASSLRDTTAAH